MSYANHSQFLKFQGNHKHIQTKFETVYIVNFNDTYPSLSRILKKSEGWQILDKLKPLLG